jgi:hypothetical protein
MSDSKQENNSLLLNSAIGFLSVLLLILFVALAARLIYPRVQSERVSQDTVLISNVIQLEVLNGCGVPGLATRFTSSLRQYGFDVVETGNFDNFDMTETLIISRNGNMQNARRVASALGIPEERILREESPDFYLDATIVIGSDFPTLNLH